jgi:hypothetical protein
VIELRERGGICRACCPPPTCSHAGLRGRVCRVGVGDWIEWAPGAFSCLLAPAAPPCLLPCAPAWALCVEYGEGDFSGLSMVLQRFASFEFVVRVSCAACVWHSFGSATLFGAITDGANVPIVKLVPTATARLWHLVTAAGQIDFEANNVRTVGVRVRGIGSGPDGLCAVD